MNTTFAAIAISAAAPALAVGIPAAAPAHATPATAAYATPATATSAATNRGAPTITRTAHVAYGNCTAPQILLSVSVPERAFAPTQRVALTVRFRNTGGTTCGAPLATGLPEARERLTVGPCATLSLTVRSSRGADLYPGPAVFHCPEETGFRLGPQSTAQSTAYWSQTAYLGSTSDPEPRQAPPGTYHLTVDQAVTVPVTLASG